MNNCRIVRECHRCLDFRSGRFTSVSLVWAHGHYNIPENCRADEIAKAGALLLESSNPDCTTCPGRNANLSWVNVKSCSTAKLTWPSINRRRTNQLPGLGIDMHTSHCVMGRHTDRMGLPFNDFCLECRSVEEGQIVLSISFLVSCQLDGAIIYCYQG